VENKQPTDLSAGSGDLSFKRMHRGKLLVVSC